MIVGLNLYACYVHNYVALKLAHFQKMSAIVFFNTDLIIPLFCTTCFVIRRSAIIAWYPILVQSFYGKKGVYLKQIATKGIFTGIFL